MKWIKGFALVTCLATPLSVIVATSASADPAADAAKPPMTTDSKPAMSEADKKAKSTDCSRQADTKKLHGEARKKFREACKRGK